MTVFVAVTEYLDWKTHGKGKAGQHNATAGRFRLVFSANLPSRADWDALDDIFS